jgi:hypothetical protein
LQMVVADIRAAAAAAGGRSGLYVSVKSCVLAVLCCFGSQPLLLLQVGGAAAAAHLGSHGGEGGTTIAVQCTA